MCRLGSRHRQRPRRDAGDGGPRDDLAHDGGASADHGVGPDAQVLDDAGADADVGAIAEIHQLIDRLAEEGNAVVMISSYLPEIMARSDRILVCRQGKVVEEFSAREATEEKIMYAAIH